jgi:hypothetical protein
LRRGHERPRRLGRIRRRDGGLSRHELAKKQTKKNLRKTLAAPGNGGRLFYGSTRGPAGNLGGRRGRGPGKSGGGPPYSRTLRAVRCVWQSRQRLGVRPPSGALGPGNGERFFMARQGRPYGNKVAAVKPLWKTGRPSNGLGTGKETAVGVGRSTVHAARRAGSVFYVRPL